MYLKKSQEQSRTQLKHLNDIHNDTITKITTPKKLAGIKRHQSTPLSFDRKALKENSGNILKFDRMDEGDGAPDVFNWSSGNGSNNTSDFNLLNDSGTVSDKFAMQALQEELDTERAEK